MAILIVMNYWYGKRNGGAICGEWSKRGRVGDIVADILLVSIKGGVEECHGILRCRIFDLFTNTSCKIFIVFKYIWTFSKFMVLVTIFKFPMKPREKQLMHLFDELEGHVILFNILI